MPNPTLSRHEIAVRSAQLRELLCQWDPIGVMGFPDWPRDEYDCLLGSLLTLLVAGATSEEIAQYLRREIEEHFGLSPGNYDFEAVATRFHRWFERGWRVLLEPVTIYLPLQDSAGEGWRPVLARPLPSGHYRIVGVNADTSQERWQFPVGSIVECREEQFAEGRRGLVAVARFEDAG